MKQIEITVRLEEGIESAISKLEKQGYKLIEEYNIYDIYMTNKINELTKDNVTSILSTCVLLRTLKFKDKDIKKLTYKNKEYDENGDVISEKKINVDCNDLEGAYKLFSALKFETLVEVKYGLRVYGKDGMEFAFQEVENLGTLIEYESPDDFEGKTKEEINMAKEKMYKELLNTGIKITNEKDVKKAKELIFKRIM